MYMLHRCKQCPGSQALQRFLMDQYEDLNKKIQFKQWQTTYKMYLVTVLMTKHEWIEETHLSIS